jgi:hypothetical protein
MIWQKSRMTNQVKLRMCQSNQKRSVIYFFSKTRSGIVYSIGSEGQMCFSAMLLA